MASSSNTTVKKLMAKAKAHHIKFALGTSVRRRVDGYNGNVVKFDHAGNVSAAQIAAHDHRAEINAKRAAKGLAPSVPRFDELQAARVGEISTTKATPRVAGARAVPWSAKVARRGAR